MMIILCTADPLHYSNSTTGSIDVGLESVRWTSVSRSLLPYILRPYSATALSLCYKDNHQVVVIMIMVCTTDPSHSYKGSLTDGRKVADLT